MTRRAAFAIGPCALALALAAPAQDATSVRDWSRDAFVRVDVPRRELVVGEVATVQVVVGIEQQALAQHALQLFRQPLDLPGQLAVPWLADSDRFAVLPATATAAAAGLSIAVGDGVRCAVPRADEVRDGRKFRTAALPLRLLARRSGAAELAACKLHLAFASTFRDDFVRGRVPEDRADVTLASEPIALQVGELPTEGRPPEFSSAVGSFTVAASAEASEVAVGERFEVTLTVRGDGALQAFAPPKLALADFHVLGVLDAGGDGARTLRYELSPLREVAELPRIGFCYFAPGDGGGYRTAWTQPIALHVRPGSAPAAGDGTAAAPARADVGDGELADIVAVPLPVAVPKGLPDALVVALLLLPWAVFASAFAWRARRGGGVVASPAELAAAFAAATERGDSDLAAPFGAWLGARLGVDALAIAADDLRTRLLAAGCDGETAERAVRLRQSLIAGRYAGVSAGARVAAQQLVAAMENAFAAAEVRA